jgi:hypothetical protein
MHSIRGSIFGALILSYGLLATIIIEMNKVERGFGREGLSYGDYFVKAFRGSVSLTHKYGENFGNFAQMVLPNIVPAISDDGKVRIIRIPKDVPGQPVKTEVSINGEGLLKNIFGGNGSFGYVTMRSPTNDPNCCETEIYRFELDSTVTVARSNYVYDGSRWVGMMSGPLLTVDLEELLIFEHKVTALDMASAAELGI